MTWLLGLFTGSSWIKWALYAAIALTVFVGGYQLAGLYYKAKIARIDAEIAQVEAMRSEEARKAEERNRQIEQEKQAEVDAIAREYVDRVEVIENRERDARIIADKLRRALAAALGRKPPEGPGAPSGRDDSALYLQLLGELNELAEKSSRAADRYAEQLKALQAYARSVSSNANSVNP